MSGEPDPFVLRRRLLGSGSQPFEFPRPNFVEHPNDVSIHCHRSRTKGNLDVRICSVKLK